MTTVTRKRYTPEFKAQAVELVALGKPVPEVAREFGIGTSILYRWVGQNPQPGRLGRDGQRAEGEEAAAELPRLRREIAHLKLENDILKKAAIILGTKPLSLVAR
jgi:transposase